MELAGERFNVVLDSGVLGFDGWGWPPEILAILIRQLRPNQLAAISKSVTAEPRTGNFKWWRPWSSVRYLGGGNWVNTYGLTNPGLGALKDTLSAFCRRVRLPIVSVALPEAEDAGVFAFNLTTISPKPFAVEINLSCVNNVHRQTVEEAARSIGEMRRVLKVPYIIKLGYDQDFVDFAERLYHLHEVCHVTNTVKFQTVYPDRRSPLGEGGVSGPEIFPFAASAVDTLRLEGYNKPIIGGGGVDSLAKARILVDFGADAVAVGTAVHFHPTLPHRIENEL